jgi:membrane protein DedA with SNARE-associated domain
VAAGLLVAAGRLSFLTASGAALAGILVGDLGLVLLGRHFGRALLRRVPFRWLITEAQMQASSAWFRERGPAVILASRFLPGSRLPTYVAAGILHVPARTIAIWLALAAALWTPLLVAVSAMAGMPLLDVLARVQAWALPAAVAALVLVWALVRIVPLTLTHRGRRLLAGRWLRITRWEFWPPWIFYPPVVVWILGLGVRHRGLTVFTAANPGSRGAASSRVEGGDPDGPRGRRGRRRPWWKLVPAGTGRFDDVADLGLPLVLKPDAGQRGSGVAIARPARKSRPISRRRDTTSSRRSSSPAWSTASSTSAARRRKRDRSSRSPRRPSPRSWATDAARSRS